jgi:hypothetical protein
VPSRPPIGCLIAVVVAVLAIVAFLCIMIYALGGMGEWH